MKKLLCPSMMCADFSCLKDEVQSLEEAGCDIFHIDIMDGAFVPNFGMGLQDVQCITRLSSRPVDAHLMIEHPENYLELFASLGVDILYIHPETTRQPASALQKMRSLGVKPGIAVTPHVSAESLEPLLGLVDYVLVMTVNPGFSGQSFLEFCGGKTEKFIGFRQKYHFQLLMDGACSPERIVRYSRAGVDGFVLGTSALFGKPQSYREILRDLREDRV